MTPKTKKPPLGLRPKHISDRLRLAEVHEAISRYMDAGAQIPDAWQKEYNDLIEKIDAEIAEATIAPVKIDNAKVSKQQQIRIHIRDVVEKYETKYDHGGLTHSEVEHIMFMHFPKVDVWKVHAEIGVHTATVRNGEHLLPHTDLILGITCVLENRSPTALEWD